MKKVAIIMGSDSDLPVVAPAIKQLKELGIEVEARVMSAHRTPKEAHEFSKNAIKNGFGVIIAAAGMAFGWCACSVNYSSGYRYSVQCKGTRRNGCDACNSYDASGNSCCHSRC